MPTSENDFGGNEKIKMLEPGDQFAGYEILRYLGGGAFGNVYLARRIHTDPHSITNEVALKILRDPRLDREDLVEAHLWLACSQHANIVRLQEAAFCNGTFYMVSEYLPGGTLRDRIGLNVGRPRVTHRQAVDLISGILRALVYLHTPRPISGYEEDQIVLHRDLKPENILLQGDTAKVTDFGVSKALASSQGVTSSAGSFAYQAPETLQGKSDVRSDVWSVGVIFFELLAGRLPFVGDRDGSVMNKIAHKEPQELPACVPVALRQVVLRALAKDPSSRYASAAMMLEALEEASEKLGRELREHPLCVCKKEACCLKTPAVKSSEPIVATNIRTNAWPEIISRVATRVGLFNPFITEKAKRSGESSSGDMAISKEEQVEAPDDTPDRSVHQEGPSPRGHVALGLIIAIITLTTVSLLVWGMLEYLKHN